MSVNLFLPMLASPHPPSPTLSSILKTFSFLAHLTHSRSLTLALTHFLRLLQLSLGRSWTHSTSQRCVLACGRVPTVIRWAMGTVNVHATLQAAEAVTTAKHYHC